MSIDRWKGPVAAIASDDRRHWFGGYSGAPADLLETVVREQLGLAIVYDDLGSRHGELDLDRGIIRINSTLFERLDPRADINAVAAFTIAHEVAHISLHQWRLQRGLPLTAEHEREAQFYAGVLLMPRRRILASHEWARWDSMVAEGKNPWPPIYRLAERYRVSPAAMRTRLEDLAKAGPYLEPTPEAKPPIRSQGSNVVPIREGIYA